MSEYDDLPLYRYATDAQGQRLHLYSQVVRVADVAALPEGADRSGLERGVVVTPVNHTTMWVRWGTATELMTSPEVLRYERR